MGNKWKVIKRLYWLNKEIQDVEKMRNKLKATADDRIKRAEKFAR